jgi:uncharacterized DUF497 family protein
MTFQVVEILWDDWNEDHIARHGVRTDEVEDVVRSPSTYVERRRNGTYGMLGRTAAGRGLLVVLAPRGSGSYYVVTSRDVTPAERRRFRS